MMDWYSLRVISGKEKKIRDSLLLEVEREGYSAKVDQVFVPSENIVEMRDGKKSELEFLVITFHTDEGISTSTFGFAGRGAAMAGEIANSIFKPFFIGRDPLFREKHWHEYRMADRWWNHAPIYSYGPFDINCWVLSALQALSLIHI